jgi:hypothetical protein
MKRNALMVELDEYAIIDGGERRGRPISFWELIVLNQREAKK